MFAARELATKLMERATVPLVSGMGLTGALLAIATEIFSLLRGA